MEILETLLDNAVLYRNLKRRYVPNELSYIILVPTLRCNLCCTYCQVSRVSESAKGFDWTDKTVEQVINFLDELRCTNIKIEFQGGEPLLALNHLCSIRDFCRLKFEKSEFVVCTNLQSVSKEAWDFLNDKDTLISTSIDGPRLVHEKQRTKTAENTETFFKNLQYAFEKVGPSRLSALPTIDANTPPKPIDIINTFVEFGITSIYLRPIAHYGFARKQHDAKSIGFKWSAYRRKFIQELIDYNFAHKLSLEEYYFSHCLRRVLRSGHNNHVDLRNPNPMGLDYILIDFDGSFYPTDEARMLTRAGEIDLSIGNIIEGLDKCKLALLNSNCSNDNDPICKKCNHQLYCGRDVIDDLARYGRIDIPRDKTDFCIRHTDIFNHIIELVESDDPAVLYSLAIWAGVSEFDPKLREILQ